MKFLVTALMIMSSSLSYSATKNCIAWEVTDDNKIIPVELKKVTDAWGVSFLGSSDSFSYDASWRSKAVNPTIQSLKQKVTSHGSGREIPTPRPDGTFAPLIELEVDGLTAVLVCEFI